MTTHSLKKWSAKLQFLEYAHYLPERGAGAAVAGLKVVAAGELEGLVLHDMIDQGKARTHAHIPGGRV